MTATTSKTAIAMLSAAILILVLSVSIFKSVRSFCWEHPGILVVVFAVAGEVVCDWNRKKNLREKLKKFFGILLVAGLLLEIAEAIRSDKSVSTANLEAKQAEKEAGQANVLVSTNERQVAELNRENLLLREHVVMLENNTIALKAAIPPRQIPEKQRELFISTLLETNMGSPQIDIKVFVQDGDDNEANGFADTIRNMLNDAGYGTNREKVIKIPPLHVSPSAGGKSERMPQIFAIYAVNYDGSKIPLSMPSFGGNITAFVPTKVSVRVEMTNPNIPILGYYSTNPNDILGGVCNILSYMGFRPEELTYPGLLKPGEVGFYIPPQVQ